jgi:hypothetical protein
MGGLVRLLIITFKNGLARLGRACATKTSLAAVVLIEVMVTAMPLIVAV